MLMMFLYSSYPDKRVKKDDKGREMGVVGSVSLLQNVTVASQPVSSMDWNSDKVWQLLEWMSCCVFGSFHRSMVWHDVIIMFVLQEGLLACCSFDQTVRVCIVTKLNRIWLSLSAQWLLDFIRAKSIAAQGGEKMI